MSIIEQYALHTCHRLHVEFVALKQESRAVAM